MDIKKITRSNILYLSSYKAKEIPCKVKLDANESPYSFKEASRVIRKIETNRYPDPEANELKGLVSKIIKVKPDSVLQGNGSDELIYYLITTFGGPVLYPTPTFSMYGIVSQAIGQETIEIPLDNEFNLDIDRILKELKKRRPKLVFLSSPNNPTGNCFTTRSILKIIEKTFGKAIIVVDEAYQPFASKEGFIPMLNDYKNLVIMRTLSKIGLAGLRVGFLIADTKIIHEVNKVRLPFNLNSLSQRIAIEVLKSKSLVRKYINSIVTERDKLFDVLSNLKGIKAYPSEANFILFKTENPDRIYQRLLKKGILIRNMKGVVEGCLRVTVGTPAENRLFLKELQKILYRKRNI